jgi:hypothetical protein
MQDFEKLGVFYLGRSFDLKAKKPKDNLILYESKDLTTHGVCLGMTGSGKTGLCICLLEEAAIDGIPVLAIDPKGDLTNLLLTFPQLRGSDFAPWVNEDDAQKAGLSAQDYAAKQAELWTKGLAAWGEDGARIQRLRDAADFVIYTPGSNAGLPLSILKSFAPPEPAVVNDKELLRERVNNTAASLLTLMGRAADTVQGREHILIATILTTAWNQGQSLDLPQLIQQIQTPPFAQVGVLALDSFFPSKDRFALAMGLNNLIASPGFEGWLEGEPLDIAKLLHTREGKPRVAVLSIAHLNDTERMFFVSLLLNQLLGWMRAQPGTTSLRALLYMDEILGYFPPVANPPSKAPLLTLLKQARAFGVGVLLATQNPVDLDYKGLSNAGTWFLGRLQSERDKARVLEGLEGAAASASAGFDRREMEQILAGLGNRVFLLHNVKEDAPQVFQVRWSLSYLRGPLTRGQIKTLMDPRRPAAAPPAAIPVAVPVAADPTAPAPPAAIPVAAPVAADAGARPLLPPEVPQFFVPLRSAQPAGSKLLYHPLVLGCATVYYSELKTVGDVTRTVSLLAEPGAEPAALNWEAAQATELSDSDLEKAPAAEALYAPPPPAASRAKSYEAWKKSLADALYRTQKIEVLRSRALDQVSKPDESERDFRVRLQQAAREDRDRRAEELRRKHAPKLAALDEKIRRATQTVDRQKGRARQSWLQALISFVATLLGGWTGKKTMSAATVGKATTAARGVGRSMKVSEDVARAEENVEVLKQQREELDAQLRAEVQELQAKVDAATEPLETVAVKPKKTNISVRLAALAWVPSWRQADGGTKPAWQ